MRVGLVSPYDLGRPGGVQAQVIGLARALISAGDEVTVLAPGLAGSLPGVDLGRTLSIPGNRSLVPLSLDPRVVAKIRRASRQLDVIHVHEPFMPLVSLAAIRAGSPVVATFHAAPGPLIGGLYRMAGPMMRRLLGGRVRRVTAVSPTAAAPLPTNLEVAIVPNGVDVVAFARDVARAPKRVAFLGRDEPRKGLDVLLEAWPAVLARDASAQLVVMGADRADEQITWMGWVDDDTKAETLASATLYVAPNLGGESFGIVLVEAMAAGAPVIASDLDSFRHVGGDAISYFAPGDATALATQIVSLLGDTAARRSMAVAGRTRAQQFDWPRVAAAYREIYREALS